MKTKEKYYENSAFKDMAITKIDFKWCSRQITASKSQTFSTLRQH
jgi:hypothetical protein